jgi:SWI/SNF-related matrix-associated actin-dependent regulator 1 of chromatin subfamily A
MGLGKTRQSILAMKHAEPDGPWLVVCPASVKYNWEREIHLVLPDAPVHIVGPEPPPEPGDCRWVVINYDLLKLSFDALLANSWRGLVFDEAHYLKNHTSQSSKLATRLVGETTGEPMVHALKGTPLTNRPRDLFPWLQLVDHTLGRSFFAFSKRYCAAEKTDYGHWVSSGASNLEWINVDLPQKAHDALNDAVRAFLGDEVMDPERDHRGRRRGIGQLSSARRKLAAVKGKITHEYVQGAVDQGQTVLVLSTFQNPITRFVRHFGEAAVAITGETPVEYRQALVDRFQNDDDVRVYIGQIHAGGTGVNLTAARLVVFNDLDWVPANHWQAEDRAYRIGQTSTVNVTYTVAEDTIEEFVRTVLESKACIVDYLVEGRSLVADLDTDVMVELRRMLKHLQAQFDSLRQGAVGKDELTDLLLSARAEYLREQTGQPGTDARATLVPVSESAIRALAAVLSGPQRTVYHIASSRDENVCYTVEVVGADVTCDCRGFHYRGACTHARDMKEALVADQAAPEGYELAES